MGDRSSTPPTGPATSFDVDLEAQGPTPRQPASPASTHSTHTHLPCPRDGPAALNDEKAPGEAAACGDEASVVGVGARTTNCQKEALLALPPPPSYDVVVEGLSVAVPPFRAYIPTPIPIPIPQVVTDAVRRWGKKKQDDGGALGDAADGLIVRNVNAVVRRGEVMAIIGGSGSGKTTLLHAMAGRLGNLPIAEGRVAITPASGGEEQVKGMSEVVGFVRQHDYLLPHLTGVCFLRSLRARADVGSARDIDVRSATSPADVRGRRDA